MVLFVVIVCVMVVVFWVLFCVLSRVGFFLFVCLLLDLVVMLISDEVVGYVFVLDHVYLV